MKKIILIFAVLLLSGCITVTSYPENTCFRYIDYKGEEHYMDYHKSENNCYAHNGMLRCYDDEKTIKVNEYEIVECPVEEK